MEVIGIELEAAVEMILDHGAGICDTEIAEVLEAGGRIVAEDIVAGFDNPPFPRSPLDGYALKSADTKGATSEAPVIFEILETIYAGQWKETAEFPGKGRMAAVRIMTGAPIPEGFDCVVRQEDVEASDHKVSVPFSLGHHKNYCFQGEDFKKGTVLIAAGTKLNYVHQGILASAGYSRVRVYRKVRVALFVTGDEVIEPSGCSMKDMIPKEPVPGKIYGSNLHMLYGRMMDMGVSAVRKEQLPDEPAFAAEAIRDAAGEADVIITTGGVSVGEKDIFHQVLPLLGAERLFWKVLLKPGTPAMFSVYHGVPMLHLSGNPFAAITTFELLAAPLLAKLSRDISLTPGRETAVLKNDFLKPSSGRRFLRGKLEKGKSTKAEVGVPDTDKHSSGILSSMQGCNCLIDIKAGVKSLKAGQEVDVWTFEK